MRFYVSTATFFLLHCDEWDRVVALPRHKFVTGATLLQLVRAGRSIALYIMVCTSLFVLMSFSLSVLLRFTVADQGRIQDFKLGGTHFKKLRRAEGGGKMFGVFRVKNHDFTPKNHIFSNFRGAHPPPSPGSAPGI